MRQKKNKQKNTRPARAKGRVFWFFKVIVAHHRVAYQIVLRKEGKKLLFPLFFPQSRETGAA